jgi:uncharacterized protein (TIGR03085 family)
MTRLAQTERAALCDDALEVGPDAPTLCEGWAVRDLVAHLLIREGSLLAAGIVVRPLAGLLDHEMRKVAGKDFEDQVAKLRTGPPRFSFYAVPRLDVMLNTLEYLVHHEDLRRAQPGWTARTLPDEDQKLIWSMARTAGKGLTRKTPVGVTIENSVTGSTVDLNEGDNRVTVRGLPSEVTLFVFGRQEQADVELVGDDADVARLTGASLGL